MASRFYGVERGPGVRLEEEIAPRPASPGKLGTTYFLGAFRRYHEQDFLLVGHECPCI